MKFRDKALEMIIRDVLRGMDAAADTGNPEYEPECAETPRARRVRGAARLPADTQSLDKSPRVLPFSRAYTAKDGRG